MGKLIDADALMETINARGTKSITIAVLQRLVDEAEEVKAEAPEIPEPDCCRNCVWYECIAGADHCRYYGHFISNMGAKCTQHKRADK